MPRLLIFAPCDNVIFAKDTESASLITILTHIQSPAVENLPVGTPMPMRWYVFSQWETLPGDGARNFEQRLRLMGGEQAIQTLVSELKLQEEVLHHRSLTASPVMPYLLPGVYRLTLDLREKGHEEWNEVGSYPLTIHHIGHMELSDEEPA